MIPLLTAYLLNIVDYIFTAYWIYKFGLEIELNPIGRWLFSHNVAWVYKIFIVGGLFALLGYFIKREPKTVVAAYICLVVYALIVIYHIGLLIYNSFL